MVMSWSRRSTPTDTSIPSCGGNTERSAASAGSGTVKNRSALSFTGLGDDEAGYRFGAHRFAPGEYVSIRDHDGEMHTFRVVAVEPVGTTS